MKSPKNRQTPFSCRSGRIKGMTGDGMLNRLHIFFFLFLFSGQALPDPFDLAKFLVEIEPDTKLTDNIDYSRSDLKNLRKDYERLQNHAEVIARKLPQYSDVRLKKDLRKWLLKITSELIRLVEGPSIGGSSGGIAQRNSEEDRANGADEVRTRFKAWLPEFLERPEVAETAFEAVWAEGKPASESAYLGNDADSFRIRGLDLLISMANGPYHRRVGEMILNPKLGMDDLRYQTLAELAIKNPSYFSRAFQGEFIKRIDRLRRVPKEQFSECKDNLPVSSDHPGDRFAHDTFSPIGRVPGAFFKRALNQILNEDFPDYVKGSALIALGERVAKNRGEYSFGNGFISPAYSGGLKIQVARNMYLRDEDGFVALAKQALSDPNREFKLWALQNLSQKKVTPKLSDAAAQSLSPLLLAALQHTDREVRLEAMAGMGRILDDNAIPLLQLALEKELARSPADQPALDLSGRALSYAIERIAAPQKWFDASQNQLRIIEAHLQAGGPPSLGTPLICALTTCALPPEGPLHPSSVSRKAALDRLIRILARVKTSAPSQRDLLHKATTNAIANLLRIRPRDRQVTFALERELALEIAGANLPVGNSPDVFFEMLDTTEALLQALPASDRAALLSWQLSQERLLPVAGAYLAGKYPSRGLHDLAKHAARPGAPQTFAIDAIAKMANRTPPLEEAALGKLKNDPRLSPLFAPAPRWEVLLPQLKNLIREERSPEFADHFLLEGTFLASAKDSKEEVRIKISRGGECENKGTFEFLKATSKEHSLLFKDSPPLGYTWIGRASVEIKPEKDGTRVSFTVGEDEWLLSRVVPEGSEYNERKADPCAKLARSLTEAPAPTKNLFLKACVAYFWDDTPFTLRQRAFIELKLLARSLGTGKQMQQTLFELWSQVAIHDPAPGLKFLALKELTALPSRPPAALIQHLESEFKRMKQENPRFEGCYPGRIKKLLEELKERNSAPLSPASEKKTAENSGTHGDRP